MKLKIGNKSAMTVQALHTAAAKKPGVCRGGDLRSGPGRA